MTASQPVEHQQRSYEVFEKKHYMECTTDLHAQVAKRRVGTHDLEWRCRPVLVGRLFKNEDGAGHVRQALDHRIRPLRRRALILEGRDEFPPLTGVFRE